MSRTFATSRIQREVIHAQGHSGSNQKSTRAWAVGWGLVSALVTMLLGEMCCGSSFRATLVEGRRFPIDDPTGDLARVARQVVVGSAASPSLHHLDKRVSSPHGPAQPDPRRR